MKKIAYLLIVAGFLYGAYVAALDENVVQWPLFAIGAVAAIAGVLLAKYTDSRMARSGTVLETNRNELNESIGNIVSCLEKKTGGDNGTDPALPDWIDNTLRDDLRRFAEARASMVHLYGLQTYADIMSEFAAGERYINRVWSASADGYDVEAATYLERAAKQFADAQRQLQQAAQGTA